MEIDLKKDPSDVTSGAEMIVIMNVFISLAFNTVAPVHIQQAPCGLEIQLAAGLSCVSWPVLLRCPDRDCVLTCVVLSLRCFLDCFHTVVI